MGKWGRKFEKRSVQESITTYVGAWLVSFFVWKLLV